MGDEWAREKRKEILLAPALPLKTSYPSNLINSGKPKYLLRVPGSASLAYPKVVTTTGIRCFSGYEGDLPVTLANTEAMSIHDILSTGFSDKDVKLLLSLGVAVGA
ncbi:hypothetical protein KIN20_000802 [Parelaphostrongylus tenuis]|uniref:Uncharacterized protein n=1 Tax=Parelaphostrongylus tenuis TaxID=148309 RepID=A0AAD5LT41_PARTN|nr:hypothetical protein KIN20_000802 [Parelaphostrongylus tenuis]